MKYILSLVLSLVLCHTSFAQNKITYIKMQRTACFGRCPEYTVELFKNGNIVYTGKKNVEKIGTYKGKISGTSMGKFLKEISGNKLTTLQDVYHPTASDLPRLNFTFTINSKTKSIKNGESGPDYLREIGRKVDSVIEQVKWQSPATHADKASDGPVLNVNLDHDKNAKIEPEQMAEFPGGEAALGEFVGKNLTYPKKAVLNNIEGKVICSFTVTKNGKIENVKVLRGLGSGCNEEAVRVIKMMPLWKPAKQNGKAVDSEFTLPIMFSLQ